MSVFCACQHDIVRETHYNVTLDAANTYIAGEPVRFNIEGEVDNLLFYSGETGSQYKYKDRYTVPAEDVKAAVLDMDFQARYGAAGMMEIWISKDFAGLNGEDGAADRQTIASMVEGGMQGWTKLDYQEGASTKWTNQAFDLSEYVDNFCIAFHWNPKDFTATQRTYWVNGKLSLELEGTAPTVMDISELGFKTVMMNEEVSDPYHKNAGNGSIILNNPNTAALIFQGVGANALTYAIDGWAISTPAPLNKVANDRSVVIKNVQNYLKTYEYTWNEPGTYKVTFVGTNESHLHASNQVQEMTVTILENI
jgi:hypothetical protein